jgi:hypothetical protein
MNVRWGALSDTARPLMPRMSESKAGMPRKNKGLKWYKPREIDSIYN